MSNTQDKTILRGTSKTYRLTVIDDNGDRVDLTGATVYFTVRTALGAAPASIAKTSANVLEIEILNQAVPATKGQADIFIAPSDTASPPLLGKLIYDVWVVLVSGKRYCVVEPSAFLVNRAVTELP